MFLFFCFLVRKIPLAGIELTSQRVRGLRGTSELPGRPAPNTDKSCTTNNLSNYLRTTLFLDGFGCGMYYVDNVFIC